MDIWAAIIAFANWLLLKAGVRDGSEGTGEDDFD